MQILGIRLREGASGKPAAVGSNDAAKISSRGGQIEPLRLGRDANFLEALKNHPGLGAFGVGRELRQIPTILAPDEYLLDIIQGQYGKQTGVLLRTTSRLIFFGKGIISAKVEEFPLDKLTSVQYSTGLMLGDVTILLRAIRPKSAIR
jgi:hypothetical protein